MAASGISMKDASMQEFPNPMWSTGRTSYMATKKETSAQKKELEDMGWKVITIWECQLKKDKQEKTLGELYEEITSN